MTSRVSMAGLVWLAVVASTAGQPTAEDQGFLGVRVKDVPLSDGNSLVTITEIVMASPAEKAGLKPGDFIRKVANVEAKDQETVVETIKMFKPGDRITIEITRDEKDLTITAVLTKRPKDP